MGVKRVPHIDCGEYDEDIGLNQHHTGLDEIHQHHRRQRQQGCGNAGGPEIPDQHGAEIAKQLEHDVPRQNVGEDAKSQCYWPEQVGHKLDQHNQWREIEWSARRHEESEETQALSLEREEIGVGEHRKRQRQCHNQMAGEGEFDRREADEASEQQEHEYGQEEWQRLPCFRAPEADDRVLDKGVNEFGAALQPAWNKLEFAGRPDEIDADKDHSSQHCLGRNREGHIVSAEFQGDENVDLELAYGIQTDWLRGHNCTAS